MPVNYRMWLESSTLEKKTQLTDAYRGRKNRCVKNKIFITVLILHLKTPLMLDVQRFLHKTTG